MVENIILCIIFILIIVISILKKKFKILFIFMLTELIVYLLLSYSDPKENRLLISVVGSAFIYFWPLIILIFLFFTKKINE